jgi:hypothetical protein
MMADRGLRHVQLIRGARQAAGLDDADEVAKLAQVHGRPLLLAMGAVTRRVIDEFARLAEAYQPGQIVHAFRVWTKWTSATGLEPVVLPRLLRRNGDGPSP